MRDPVTLLRQLAAAPATFDFYAAMRQIECAYPALPRTGHALSPAQEALRFGQHASLAFEPAMLAGLAPGDGEGPAWLKQNFFGLVGVNGPLPLHLIEYVRDRQRNMNDPTLARFLDIFHHRLLCLFYRAWSSAQPTVSLDRPDGDRFGQYVASLIGLGMPSLRLRDAVPDDAKLHYAGRLGAHARSADGLAAVLGDFLQVPARIQQFVGQWMRLPEDALCLLRGGHAAAILGHDTVLGRQVWGAQHRFRVVLGPMSLSQARAVLPGGPRLASVVDWVRNYAGLALDWDIQLIVDKEELSGMRLGQHARLGWNSWLFSKPPVADDAQLCFRPPAAPFLHSSQGNFHD